MNITTRSGSGTATGFRRTALTTEKMAVLAPMPSVSAATAASVKAGLCANIRTECLRSLRKASMGGLDAAGCGFVVATVDLQAGEFRDGLPRFHDERPGVPRLGEGFGLCR